MFLALQDPKPFIVVPIPAPVHETSFVDVILSALGLTGALIVAVARARRRLRACC